jgi:hypothetical protein
MPPSAPPPICAARSHWVHPQKPGYRFTHARPSITALARRKIRPVIRVRTTTRPTPRTGLVEEHALGRQRRLGHSNSTTNIIRAQMSLAALQHHGMRTGVGDRNGLSVMEKGGAPAIAPTVVGTNRSPQLLWRPGQNQRRQTTVTRAARSRRAVARDRAPPGPAWSRNRPRACRDIAPVRENREHARRGGSAHRRKRADEKQGGAVEFPYCAWRFMKRSFDDGRPLLCPATPGTATLLLPPRRAKDLPWSLVPIR